MGYSTKTSFPRSGGRTTCRAQHHHGCFRGTETCNGREGSINLLGTGMGEFCSLRKCYPGPKGWRKWNCDGFGDPESEKTGVISELGNRLGHIEGLDVVQSSESARFEYWLCHVLPVRLWANDFPSLSQISRNRTGVLCVS